MTALKYLSARVLIVCALLFPTSAPGGPYVELGPADNLALDQPRVAVEVYIPEPEESLGPEFFNYFLLDTGSQAIIAGAQAYADMADQGYQTEGTFEELGIGGTQTYDVSAVYNFRFGDSEGAPQVLPDVRLLSHPTASFGFDGIVGTPAMVNRVTTLDLVRMANIELMGVYFPETLPPSNGHRYTVPLDLVQIPPPEQDPNSGPMPTYGPVPFFEAELRHAGQSATASFLLDTGAQLSIVSTDLAFAAGLDENDNGSLDDEILYYLPISGVGGMTLVPVLAADEIVVPTEEGIDLVWTDLLVLLLDIHPDVEGIFSCDPLTSGYVQEDLTIEVGYIEQVHLDFTNMGEMTGDMLLDLNPAYDVVIPEPGTLIFLGVGALALSLKRRKQP